MTMTSCPAFTWPLVANSLKRARARDGDGRGLLEREVGRLRRKQLRGDRHVLSEGTHAGAEHLIARTEPRDAPTNGFDPTGDLLPGDPSLGSPQTEYRTDRIRQPGHDVPVSNEDARRVNVDQHLGGSHCGLLDILEHQDVGTVAVPILDDRLHDPLRDHRE